MIDINDITWEPVKTIIPELIITNATCYYVRNDQMVEILTDDTVNAGWELVEALK